MPNTPHAPGPWKVTGYENLTVNSPKGNTIVAAPGSDTGSLPELKANAALIAAAPELLEALQIMVVSAEYMAEKGLPFPAGIERARAALAKARGE